MVRNYFVAMVWAFYGVIVPPLAQAQILPGDVVFGLSRSGAPDTLELVRGPAAGPGAAVPDFWTGTQFIQGVRFDNLGGVAHNGQGNLLGVNFGTTAAGGSLYNFSTTDSSVTTGQLIGDTTSLGVATVTKSRLSSLSVSPNNTKIAVNGYDSGTVLVYEYQAGDTKGAGAQLSGGRETVAGILTLADNQGTAWMDDNTVLTFNTDGSLLTVDATTMAHTLVKSIATPFQGSPGTALAYNPDVSPYVYALYGQFADPVTTNTLYIVDPRSNFDLVKTIDLSISSSTVRDAALDEHGNLFFTAFGNATTGTPINVLLNAADVNNLADNSSVNWYTSPTGASFSGLDVAFVATNENPCDLNGDGLVDGADVGLVFNAWGEAAPGTFADKNGDGFVDGADLGAIYNSWTGDSVPTASVPEPAGFGGVMGILMLSVFGCRKSNCIRNK
ncbi:MAG: dockerin type I domain-containing protein [Planctomycetota bacterium]|nr:dockerin type I domain-containing protein [Planctomycetota bacterium]MDA1180404.1 dockerin type I domain-containing protein [Planctomycetota bacterium]